MSAKVCLQAPGAPKPNQSLVPTSRTPAQHPLKASGATAYEAGFHRRCFDLSLKRPGRPLGWNRNASMANPVLQSAVPCSFGFTFNTATTDVNSDVCNNQPNMFQAALPTIVPLPSQRRTFTFDSYLSCSAAQKNFSLPLAVGRTPRYYNDL